jgi:hypothetical protein
LRDKELLHLRTTSVGSILVDGSKAFCHQVECIGLASHGFVCGALLSDKEHSAEHDAIAIDVSELDVNLANGGQVREGKEE